MKHIWKVEVHLTDGMGFDRFNVEAKDDVEAKEKGIRLMVRSHGDDIKIKYVELEHKLEFED